MNTAVAGGGGARRIRKRALVAQYVRELLANRERAAEMTRSLRSGMPFVTSCFAAVVMVDVFGYSALTTALEHPSIRIEVPDVGAHYERPLPALRKEDTASSKIPKELSLHVAMTAGETEHVVVGNPGTQMDYFIQGDCLVDIAKIINDAKSGEVGISMRMWSILERDLDTGPLMANKHDDEIILAKGAMRVFWGILSTKLSRRASGLRAHDGLMSDAVEQFWTAASGRDSVGEAELLERFSNQSFVYKINKSEYQSAFKENDESDLSNIKAEFRTVSVLFASFYPGCNPQNVQIATTLFLDAIKKTNGVFYQYSVNDKGHSLLCFFGLPPFASEQNAPNVLNAGVMFVDSMEESALGPVSVSVSSGDLIYSMFGGPSRLNPSFLGDVVNVAARIMAMHDLYAAGRVICDEATQSACRVLSFIDLWKHLVKGKTTPLEVFGINRSALDYHFKTTAKLDLVGYPEEIDLLYSSIHRLQQESVDSVFVIEGVSGVGRAHC
ncbi:Adenylate cyclase type 10 [Irineochytrium annulatum]|nr:Adenylate cyclase type 10 [Irineochytrium annulatum]